VDEMTWLASANPQAILDAVSEANGDHPDRTFYGQAPYQVSNRKLRLFACACRRRVPGLVWDGQSAGWQHMEDYPEEEILANDVGPHTVPAINHARLFIGHQEAPSQSEMAALLREIVGNPWRQVKLPEGPNQRCPLCKGEKVRRVRPTGAAGTRKTHLTNCRACRGKGTVPGPCPCPWLTPQALAMAEYAYESRDFSGLPILADVLEESGCQEEMILHHLRGEEPILREVPRQTQTIGPPLYHLVGWRLLRGPHCRGCAAIDALLGKS